jgi:hypothetical protein
MDELGPGVVSPAAVTNVTAYWCVPAFTDPPPAPVRVGATDGVTPVPEVVPAPPGLVPVYDTIWLSSMMALPPDALKVVMLSLSGMIVSLALVSDANESG